MKLESEKIPPIPTILKATTPIELKFVFDLKLNDFAQKIFLLSLSCEITTDLDKFIKEILINFSHMQTKIMLSNTKKDTPHTDTTIHNNDKFTSLSPP